MRKAEEWIERLRLEPHPEGGWYRETYRSERSCELVGDTPFDGPRSCATSIYYLLRLHERSRLHRIHSDELWFFHDGSPLDVCSFPEQGEPAVCTIGIQGDGTDCTPFCMVRAGSWFGARLHPPAAPGSWSLVSCVVAPGFDFRDFSFASRQELCARFPAHATIITELT